MFMHMHARGCGHRDGHHAAMGGGYGGGRGGGRFAFAWGPGEGERPGGGRQRRMFDGGELRLVLLKLIADSPRHGYDLIRAIEELTGGAYAPSPGVVYPTITLLDESRQPVMVWKFHRAWPCKWSGPSLNAKSNEVAIESLEICHEGLELE